ncbi:hypothetical protein [Shewanella sp. GutCb]|uniref:hypothetical protein n=1 Tax=Shewanella sp. GutCb TaxID=2058315 RepID=UPI0011AE6AAF|nr:hypothetical protein [Shewanella sp. GutCb]
MSDRIDIKKKYSHQLKLRRKYAYPGLLLFVLSLVSLVFISELRVKPWFFIILGIGLFGFLVGLFGLNYWSRCPACNKVPRQGDGSIPSAAMDKCPNCGATLSDT